VVSSPVLVVLDEPDPGPTLVVGVNEYDDGSVDLGLTIPKAHGCLDVLSGETCTGAGVRL
jgi:hypothetical protein